MKLSIEEQKSTLKKRLRIEDLRRDQQNQEDIKSFIQATQGDHISDYLINSAWNDDNERNTKVFLIRDTDTNEIAFYFAINCGILFSELNVWNLSASEKIPFDKYVEAEQKLKDPSLSPSEIEKYNDQLSSAMGDMWEAVEDPDRVSFLMGLADEKVQLLKEKNEASENTDDAEHIQHVQETFPAIDIKFLGRNKNYKTPIQLDFRLGVYVFWEIIVPHLLNIADLVGCKYIYLFAADNSETESITPQKFDPPMYTPDYDPDEKFEEPEKKAIHKLVDYYIQELKFKPVQRYKILNPQYERTCYTLVQAVEELESNRASVWNEHPDISENM